MNEGCWWLVRTSTPIFSIDFGENSSVLHFQAGLGTQAFLLTVSTLLTADKRKHKVSEPVFGLASIHRDDR